MSFNIEDHLHKRFNPFIDDWVLVWPQRAKCPWQGQVETSISYSEGLHQVPTHSRSYQEWHQHMHYYPSLLRSAKFMIGYELLEIPQRDITAVQAALQQRNFSEIHYKK